MTSAMLDVNFAPKRREPGRALGVGVLVCGILALAITVAEYQHNASIVANARAIHNASSDKARIALAANQNESQNPAVAAELKRDDKVLDALMVPWNPFFSMIEGAGNQDIALLQLVPDPHSGSVSITAEAKSLDDALHYVARLGAQPLLHQVHLSSYQSGQRDGSTVVQFVVVAQWP